MRRDHYTTIDSTNREALRRWQADGPLPPLAITADTQTAGLGRSGRKWLSPVGGLWMTVLWPFARDAAHYTSLPLAVGAAMAEFLECRHGLPCRLKWPNDVLVGNRKLAGVLCQTELTPGPGAVAVGIGLNGNFARAVLDEELLFPATTLQHELGAEVDLAEVRGRLVEQLEQTLSEFDLHGLGSALENIRRRLAWVGQDVVVCVPGQPDDVAGRVAGIDDTGHLVLDCAGRQRTITSGDLLRPAC